MLDYFSSKKARKHPEKATKSEEPVLNDDDEAFLQSIMSQIEGTPPPLPERPHELPVAGETCGNDMQVALSEEAKDVPIPDVPDTPEGILPGASSENSTGNKGKGKEKVKDNKKNRWSFLRRSSKDHKLQAAADGLHHDAQGSKAQAMSITTDDSVTPKEAKKEEEEISDVLEKLNLAAVDNRVFSISKESRELLRKFTLVFKDLANGVPTAYHDLESLLTNSEDQLQTMYKSLPSFMQHLIEKLPAKFTSSLGPEILAVAAEKQGLKADLLRKGASAASSAGVKIKVPSLKELVTKQGALVGMLRAIINFLRTRFPAVVGINVLWSLALSILLLICWYCHKRGKEVRLEKERAVTEAEMAAIKAKVESDPAAEYHGPMTTLAPEGAPIEDVQASLEAAQSVTPQTGQAQYAEGGSLAKSLKEENAAKESANGGPSTHA